MEFLDPKKQKQHLIQLAIGYVLVGMALLLTTVILLYRAYGYGLKNGEVIQNGLVFVSTQPNPADIYIDGKKSSNSTNTRMLLPAGQYTFELRRDGYRPWKRAITIDGGAVGRFDYPVLFPTELKPVAVKAYAAAPLLETQSLDRHWLLIQNGAFNTFDLFDSTKPKDIPKQVAIPLSVVSLKGASHTWQAVEWASDNKHVLLKHGNGQASEYILFNRESPEDAINLTATLQLGAGSLQLINKKYDHYYVFSAEDKTLATATLGNPTSKVVLQHVLQYIAHDDKRILYVTDQNAPAGKAIVMLQDGSNTYAIRQVGVSATYLLDIANYSNDWYVVAGSSADNRTYVYKDPAAVLQDKPKSPLVPVQVFKVPAASFVSFSNNARFIVAQNAGQFAIYDAETDKGYAYALKVPIDAGQVHVRWMDGHRMMLISGGQVVVFDFDDANQETLSATDALYNPMFDRTYAALYTLAPQTGQAGLTLLRTPLLTPADQ